jgi:hypothetical protein
MSKNCSDLKTEEGQSAIWPFKIARMGPAWGPGGLLKAGFGPTTFLRASPRRKQKGRALVYEEARSKTSARLKILKAAKDSP